MTPGQKELLPCPFCGGAVRFIGAGCATSAGEDVQIEHIDISKRECLMEERYLGRPDKAPDIWNTRTNEATPAGFVMVPKAKLEEWRYNASKARRAGHICDADRMCMSLEQSIKAMLSAIPRPEQEG